MVMKKALQAVVVGSLALSALVAAPASAQDYGRGGYGQNDDQYARYAGNDGRDDRYQDERRQDEHRQYRQARHHYNNARRYRGYDQAYNGQYSQGYVQQDGYAQQRYQPQRRCSSGTTGAVLGAVLGGLLGREVGRGGAYNEPSTTGLIIGAGGGALAGRAVERNGCR